MCKKFKADKAKLYETWQTFQNQYFNSRILNLQDRLLQISTKGSQASLAEGNQAVHPKQRVSSHRK